MVQSRQEAIRVKVYFIYNAKGHRQWTLKTFIFKIHVLFFSNCFHDGFLPIKLINYHTQNVEMWRCNIECHDLISACDV